ncbi:DUF5057 domain-containing protein [Bacillus sp. BRMEA1]|uniref:DUF5057 domain-containing protein n=1 Tax=Neobacillus endophyticus TaxID=2738405 RepID=UPI001565D025|nr:DUF5057 domain-containing protein [Neobacillus endophyticus]NRD76013.1 DUF5057 domain-containing protein [Neobacillus endophyticus]
MKKIVSIFSMILLLFSFIIPKYNEQAKADTASTPKIKVLEIVDTGSSKLASVLVSNIYSITTITMKQFVASRDELDGEYDAIAIPDGGTYSTKTVAAYISELKQQYPSKTDYDIRALAHNTTNLLNDITNLRSQEIINDFINKGQPVLLGENSINNNGNLANFTKYFNKPNVLHYKGNQQQAASLLSNFFSNSSNLVRPRFALTSGPSELSQKYKPGDNLQFNFNLLKPSNIQAKDLRVRLYIDSDFNDKYDPSEIVLEQPITNTSTTISYTLPRGYSGIRNWKLEVIDMGTNLKDYLKGTIYFVDKRVDINVLQVKRNANDDSSLLSSYNMNQSYLNPSSGEYKINIDVTSIDQFNKSAGATAPYSHETVNGKYDMLIFGFSDVYNETAVLNPNSANSIENFIKTNQSVMFTHDTIFKSSSTDNNLWVSTFMNDTGQISPQTNLGYQAPNTSTQTNKVNDGMMTKYPFVLGKNIQIATTHNQYYTLNLEDPTITPWYNIIGSNRDPNDSWNHYYTYSKGNVTYSGTGHTSSRFPDDEQKLFVNTMYRAFLGSNHAPVLTVMTPSDGDVIPANQKIELAYNIQDFDLKDKSVSTQVYLNDNLVYSADNLANGSTVVQSIDHGMPNGGTAVLKIDAMDKSGAKSEKVLNLTIQKVTAPLQVSRTASTSDIVPVNKEINLNYSINPQDLTGTVTQKLGNTVTISGIKYSESFPANMDVVVPAGFSKTGDLSTGYTIQGNLPSITYTKSDDKYVASPVTFNVTVIPREKNQFTLNNASISYQDIDNSSKTAQFNAITARSDYAITNIQLPDSVVLNKGVPKNFALDLKISPENAGIKEIKWSETTNNTILSIDPDTGVVTANSTGAGYVKVKVTDVFGNVKEASTYVTVRVPVQSINVSDLTMNVGETKTLPITVTPDDAKYGITISVEDPSLATIDKDQFTITGLKSGTTNLIVSGINADGNVITQKAKLTINNVLVNNISVQPSDIKLNKLDEFTNFIVNVQPDNATDKNLIWKSLNPSIADVLENGRIRGESTGTTKIIITSEDGNAQTSVNVTVGSPLIGVITNPPEISIIKGDNSKNASNFIVYNPSDATNIKAGITYQTSNNYIVDVDSTGQIFAKRLGSANISITVHDDAGNAYSTILKVNVIDQNNGNQGNDKY